MTLFVFTGAVAGRADGSIGLESEAIISMDMHA